MKEFESILRMDIDEIELVEVSELERKRVKNFVLGTKKRRRRMFRNVVAAALVFVGASVTVGFAFPSFASQLPIAKNIMSYFTNQELVYNIFSENSTTIEQFQSSNGLSIMIENAVFDGTSLTVTYALETTERLGKDLYPTGRFDIKETTGGAATSKVEKINDTSYIGFETITPHFKNGKTLELLNVTWAPKSFTDIETGTEINGDWQFHFTVDQLAGDKKIVGRSTHSEGIVFNIQTIDQTDLSTVIKYELFVDEEVRKKSPHASVSLAVTDNLDNYYVSQGNGGIGKGDGSYYEYSDSMKSINPQATSLIIVPTIHLQASTGDFREEKEMSPIVIELQ